MMGNLAAEIAKKRMMLNAAVPGANMKTPPRQTEIVNPEFSPEMLQVLQQMPFDEAQRFIAESRQPGVAEPMIDPISAGAGGFGVGMLGGAKAGMKVLPNIVKSILQGGLAAATDYPAGFAAEQADARIPGAGLPVALASGLMFGKALEGPFEKYMTDVAGQLGKPRNIEALGFTNKLPGLVEQLFPKKSFDPEHGMKILDDMLRTGKVKADEIDFSGVREFLKDEANAGRKVSGKDIRDFIQENQLQLEEVVKGEDPIESLKRERQSALERGATDEVEEIDDELAWALQHGDNPEGGGTKFGSYKLPGGENYREFLLQMPDTSEAAKLREEASRRGYGDKISEWPDQEFAQRYREKVTNAPEREGFTGSHWDELNVVVHMRTQDFTDADGKKVLLVEEVQSDWHQKGRKEGYQGDIPKVGEKFWSQARGIELERLPDLRNKPESTIYVKDNTGAEFYVPIEELKEGVPDAPFKKTWPMVAMKRMIRKAAEEGYDRVAWTPGELQADRYDLSKQVDKISYNNSSNHLYVEGKDGQVLMQETKKPEELADIVGKEVAEKLVSPQEGNPPLVSLSGLDLKVGGEGMKAFYDVQLPRMVDKYVKKWGAKTGTANLKTDVSEFGVYNTAQQPRSDWGQNGFYVRNEDGLYMGKDGEFSGSEPKDAMIFSDKSKAYEAAKAIGKEVHYIEITPEMKRDVLKKGQPLAMRMAQQSMPA